MEHLTLGVGYKSLGFAKKIKKVSGLGAFSSDTQRIYIFASRCRRIAANDCCAGLGFLVSCQDAGVLTVGDCSEVAGKVS